MLANLKIRHKLVLMLFFPVLGLLGLMVTNIIHKYNLFVEMKEIEEIIRLSAQADEVFDSVLLERELSEEFLRSKGHQFNQALQQQRSKTDLVLANFFTHLDSNVLVKENREKQLLVEELHYLNSYRAEIDRLILDEALVINKYFELSDRLINFIKILTTLRTHEQLLTMRLGYIHFLEIQDLAAKEHCLFMDVLTQKHFTLEQFKEFLKLMAQQQIHQNVVVDSLLTQEQQTSFKHFSSLADSVFQEVQKIREQAEATGAEKVIDIDPQYWSNIQWKKMNFIDEFSHKILAELLLSTSQVRAQVYLELLVTLSLLSLFVIVAGVLFYLISREIIFSLGKVVNITQKIAVGDFSHRIEIHRTDEIGQLLQALADMQNQLKIRTEENQVITNEALRINQALDNVTTHTLIADNNYQIIYLNHAAQRLFEEAQHIIRQELPQFDAHQLQGSNIDLFHKEPAQIRQLLNTLTQTHRTTIHLAGLTIESYITPILNLQGERLGVVVELNNRTLEVATIAEINEVIQAVSKGYLNQRIQVEGKTGFFQVFSERVNQAIEANEHIIKEIMVLFSALAQGRLTFTLKNKYTGDFEKVTTDAKTTINKLTEVITNIQRTANIVNTTAEEISSGNTDLNHRTTQQTASLQEIAASMQQMTSTLQHNASNTQQAKELATRAKSLAQGGGKVINATVRAMNEIHYSSRKITDIISMINDIAFQTNLLALNAAVEASRAGEHGLGFAVVASEVRNLAQRSASAAQEIKKLIQESVSKVQEGTQLANKSGEALTQIVEATHQVNDIISDISTATQEQSVGIQYVNTAITQIDSMTQQNAALVEQVASASHSLQEQAKYLKQQVAFFQLQDMPLSEKLPRSSQKKMPVIEKPPLQPPPSTLDDKSEWEDF